MVYILHVNLLEPIIFSWLLDFWESYEPLTKPKSKLL
jgi:hypothetical protein